MGIEAIIDESAKSKIKDEIVCTICTLIFEDPVSLDCCRGHFCSKCFDKVRKNFQNCPLCCYPNFTAKKGRLMATVLSTLHLQCPNADCGISIPYDNFKLHQKNCLALHDQKCPECDETTSLTKFHEHFKCFKQMASKLRDSEKKNATLTTKLTEAEERNGILAKELEEMKKEQPPSARTRSKKRKINQNDSNEGGQRGQRAVNKKKQVELLEKMRKELGAIGGAGHFFGNDKWFFDSVRDSMQETEIRNVLKLLALGETEINLKEREL